MAFSVKKYDNVKGMVTDVLKKMDEPGAPEVAVLGAKVKVGQVKCPVCGKDTPDWDFREGSCGTCRLDKLNKARFKRYSDEWLTERIKKGGRNTDDEEWELERRRRTGEHKHDKADEKEFAFALAGEGKTIHGHTVYKNAEGKWVCDCMDYRIRGHGREYNCKHVLQAREKAGETKKNVWGF